MKKYNVYAYFLWFNLFKTKRQKIKSIPTTAYFLYGFGSSDVNIFLKKNFGKITFKDEKKIIRVSVMFKKNNFVSIEIYHK